jgi:hypothetical protein
VFIAKKSREESWALKIFAENSEERAGTRLPAAVFFFKSTMLFGLSS